MRHPEKKFVLKHVFSGISQMAANEKKDGNSEIYFGIPWVAHIEKSSCSSHLSAYLTCLWSSDAKWSITADFEIKMLSPLGRDFSEKLTSTKFENENISNGKKDFKLWTEMEKEFVKDDSILMEFHVDIEEINGIFGNKLINFDGSAKNTSDYTFLVGDEQFHISKFFLSNQSSYFNALFLGGFAEAQKVKSQLLQVDPTVFQKYLEILYGENPITDENSEELLEMGDMYSTPLVMKKIEEFLISDDSKMQIREKLRLSAKFQLKNLKVDQLSKINSVSDIRSALSFDSENMDSSILAALLRKSISLQTK